MKIAFVFDDSLDKTDGVQQYMFSLADFYTAQGHDVHWLVGETKRTDLPNVHSLSRNVAVRFNGNRMSIPLGGSPRRIRALLAAESFDVLHVQMPYHPLLAGRIIRAAGPQTVVFGTFHIAPYSWLADFATKLLGIWSRPSLRRFNQIVSVSPAAADLARRAFGVTTEVIPNVFDYQRFHDAQPLPAYKDDIKTVLFLGRLVPRKGCALLLQAVAQLRTMPDLPAFRVVICGGGQLENELKTYVRDQKLTDVVTFAGRVSEADKPRYMASADISVFPSSGGESFGIVLIEAMASGHAAVLGGDNPGYASVLGGRPEQLIDPHDAIKLATMLHDLLTDEPRRQAAADWGQQQSVQYDVRTVGLELLQYYATLAAQLTKK